MMNSSASNIPLEKSIQRVPVEIWSRIFRFILGPSISSPNQSSVKAYDNAHIPSGDRMLSLYKEQEEMRAPLRGVCRSWKDLADALDDRLVVAYSDGFTWPPGRNTRDAKRIHYSAAHNPHCIVSAEHRKAIKSRPPTYRFPKNGHDYFSTPFDPNACASIIDVVELRLHVPEDMVVASETSPRSLNYSNYSIDPDTLHALWHPLFRHLTSLFLEACFPFQLDSPFDHLTLPDLHYFRLSLMYYSSDLYSPEEGRGTSIVTWRFPKLRMFRLNPKLVYERIQEELPAFLDAHAATLEEVQLYRYTGSEVAGAVDWKEFKMLKNLSFCSLDTIHAVIPALPQLSISAHTSPTAPLPVYFSEPWLWESTSVDKLNDAIRDYPEAFSRVVFHLQRSTWDELSSELQCYYTSAKNCLVLPLFATLTVLDRDGEPLDSPAGLRARQAAMEVQQRQRL